MKKMNFILLVIFSLSVSGKSFAQMTITKTSMNWLQWAEGLVWYQIFPERFYNGDPSNDPTQQEVPRAEKQPGWQIHPWTSDWYKLQPWELKQSDEFYRIVFERRYGGDLIGVIKKLDYLKELGIGGIYFNPVFEANSLHKYDGSTFHHIDDNFGPDPVGDKERLAMAKETENPDTWIWTSADSTFLKLIKEAHRREIKIVIDGVFNHTGRAFFAFQDLVKNQQASRYANWYDVIAWDDPATKQNEFDYKGWWGHKSLPEFKEDSSGIAPGPSEYIFNITRRWMDPNSDGDPSDGIDGWRLDAANEVNPVFWQKWNQRVKSINSNALTIAEIWDDASAWIDKGCFDGTMNYLFAKAVVKYFINSESGFSKVQFMNRLKEIQDMYRPKTIPLLWSVLDSHDTERIASMIRNPGRKYDFDGIPASNNNYNVEKPDSTEIKLQKLIVAFQMTYPGAPIIYYGDEAGMWGADDPDDRKPMLWSEFNYDDEMSYPINGRSRKPDKNVFNQELFNFYKMMIKIHSRNRVFKEGTVTFLNLPSKNLVGFIRQSEKQVAYVFINKSQSREKVNPDILKIRHVKLFDAVKGKNIEFKTDKKDIEIPGYNFLILVSD